MTNAEKVFYQDDKVLVTQSRFVSRGKTFAMQNISSVSKIKESKIVYHIISVLLLLVGIFFMSAYVIEGALIIVFALALLIGIKDEYIVQITSNSGDDNALKSTNKEYIQKIVDGINEAIIYRG